MSRTDGLPARSVALRRSGRNPNHIRATRIQSKCVSCSSSGCAGRRGRRAVQGHLLAEIGRDMSVFGSAHAFAAWAGQSPGNNESAGKRNADRITAPARRGRARCRTHPQLPVRGLLPQRRGGEASAPARPLRHSSTHRRRYPPHQLECSGRGNATKLITAPRISRQRYAGRLSPGVDNRRACLQTRATMNRNANNRARARSPP